MISKLTESTVEEALLEWIGGLDYSAVPGAVIAPGEPTAKRDSLGDVLLVGRLRDAIDRFNSQIPAGSS